MPLPRERTPSLAVPTLDHDDFELGTESSERGTVVWSVRRACASVTRSPLSKAKEWGLYISTSRGMTSIGIEEPALFSEPGVFLVRRPTARSTTPRCRRCRSAAPAFLRARRRARLRDRQRLPGGRRVHRRALRRPARLGSATRPRCTECRFASILRRPSSRVRRPMIPPLRRPHRPAAHRRPARRERAVPLGRPVRAAAQQPGCRGAPARAALRVPRARSARRVHRHDSREDTSPLKLSLAGGTQLDGLETGKGDIVVVKDVNSAFVGTSMEVRLRRAGVGAAARGGLLQRSSASRPRCAWPATSASMSTSPTTRARRPIGRTRRGRSRRGARARRERGQPARRVLHRGLHGRGARAVRARRAGARARHRATSPVHVDVPE